MTRQVASIDVGSGYIKGVTNTNARVLFPSYAGLEPEGFTREFGSSETRGVLVYQGRRWIVGEDAPLVLSDLADTRTDKWAGDDAWVVLVLAALHKAGFRSGEVDLVVSVPQKLWSPELYDRLKRLLVGRRSISLDGVLMDINIPVRDSMIMPQAYSGLVWVMDNDDDARMSVEQGGALAGIDPGTYTTGYVVFEEGRYSRQFSGGLPDVGMWQIGQRVQARLDQKYGLRPPVDRVLTMIRNPSKVLIKREITDIRPILDEAVHETVRPLLDRLSSVWGDMASAMDIVVYGGGATLFLPKVKTMFPHARMIEGLPPSGEQFIPAVGMLSYFMTRNEIPFE